MRNLNLKFNNQLLSLFLISLNLSFSAFIINDLAGLEKSFSFLPFLTLVLPLISLAPAIEKQKITHTLIFLLILAIHIYSTIKHVPQQYFSFLGAYIPIIFGYTLLIFSEAFLKLAHQSKVFAWISFQVIHLILFIKFYWYSKTPFSLWVVFIFLYGLSLYKFFESDKENQRLEVPFQITSLFMMVLFVLSLIR